jgi:hypothetical protein
MPIFPHQLKLLSVTSWCKVANMVSETEVSSLNLVLADVIYQHKLQPTPISHLRPTGAAHEGEC